MASESQNRGTWRVPGGSARPWRKLISGSVLTAALVDPTPSATKPVTVDGARNGVMDVDGHLVASLMFGGTDAANEIINWQAILWNETSNPLSTEAWIGRVIANGTATLGTDVYAVEGLGTITNLFADTITDTVGLANIYSPADNTRAIIEIPLLNAQRLEIQTDLPASGPMASVDVFVQLGEPSVAIASHETLTFSRVKIDHTARMTLLDPGAGKIARLHALVVVAAAAATLTVHYDDDGAGANAVALTGAMALAQNGTLVIPFERNIEACLVGPTAKFLTLTPSAAVDGYAIVSSGT